MPWAIEYIAEKEMASLVVTGDIEDEDCGCQVAETTRLLNEHEARLVLVDCSDSETKASLPGLYRLPDYATQLGAPWNARVAVVVSRTRFRIETFQFFELVFRNAGYDVRLFDDRQSAEGWLNRPRTARAGLTQAASA